ncbi:MAG TPA: molybdopterin synthase sulfur carrier subunit [Paenibacillaceae bacterium]|nr:molybdopterin synthase sulfur carrier subunit [Paenibacillaceae bacterium]
MITVLLFSYLAEEAGRDQIQLQEGELSIGELKEKLEMEYNLSPMDQVMAAINQEYVTNEEKIKRGDIIALIPPVSGG